jgi:hypothetical protein
MPSCVYCKADEAEYYDRIPLCTSCAGRFAEGPQAPSRPIFPKSRRLIADAIEDALFEAYNVKRGRDR